MSLVVERGISAISLAAAERRAGLNRGVAAYHFRSVSALLAAVADLVLVAPPPSSERGLTLLLSWIRASIVAVADRQPRALAMLHLATVAGLPAKLAAAQGRHWETTAAFVEANLARGQVLQQVRQDLDPTEAAPVLVGQLHGELIRLVTTQGRSSNLFFEFVEKALAPAPTQAKRPPRQVRSVGPDQRPLFDEG